jgi:hypothetical protein
MNRNRTGQKFPIQLLTLCILLVGFAGAPAIGQPSSENGIGITAEHDGQHDFDFIFGRWKIHLKLKIAGSNTWTEFGGSGVYRKVWDGRANLNEFEADSPSGHIEGLTLRTYNPQTHLWSLYWVNSKDGILDTPQIGAFRNGRGEFYDQEPLNGRAILVRFVSSNITRIPVILNSHSQMTTEKRGKLTGLRTILASRTNRLLQFGGRFCCAGAEGIFNTEVFHA